MTAQPLYLHAMTAFCVLHAVSATQSSDWIGKAVDQGGKAVAADDEGKAVADDEGKAVADEGGKAVAADEGGKVVAADEGGKAVAADQEGKAEEEEDVVVLRVLVAGDNKTTQTDPPPDHPSEWRVGVLCCGFIIAVLCSVCLVCSDNCKSSRRDGG